MAASDEMTAFVTAIDRGSFAEAAKALSLTPSAISKTVTRLEERLGTQLLTRTTRRLALTDEGETFLARCREILAAIESAEAEAARSGGIPRGLVRVTSAGAVARSQIAGMLPDFRAAYPEISIDLRISERSVDLLAENIDIAVRAGTLADSSFIARKLFETKRLICASPAYLSVHGTPERPEDLLEHNCIRLTGLPQLAHWPFRVGDGVSHLEVSGNVTTDSADVMLDMAIAGQGIIRMIGIRVLEPIRNGLLVPLLTDTHRSETVPIWAVTPPQRNHIPRVRVFLDFMIARFADLPPVTANAGSPP